VPRRQHLAILRPEKFVLRRGFDTFGHPVQVERKRHVDNRAYRPFAIELDFVKNG